MSHTEASLEAKRKIWWALVIAPYMIGILWHVMHPMLSIFTGDFSNPRRSYIDESSLEPNHFKRDIKYPVIKTRSNERKSSSLCEILANKPVSCFCEKGLEIASVLPTATAIAPVNELLVVVLPSSNDWLGNQLHYSTLQLVVRLSSSDFTPWLAKTVLFVAPDHSVSGANLTQRETVNTFLDIHVSGSLPHLHGSIIRHLLVLDVISNDTYSSDFRILPQGRLGILPNMDLVFLCTKVFSRGLSTSLSISPYREATRSVLTSWSVWLPWKLQPFVNNLLELLGFEYTLLTDPIHPHASALDQGIDSLTIQVVSHENHALANVVAGLEYILRALSNLHEHLHHSTSMYLLVSPDRFVKHEEYLVPTILLLLPCIVRAILILFVELHRLDLNAVKRALVCTIFATILVSMVGLPLLEDTKDAWSVCSNVNVSLSANHVLVGLGYLLLQWFGVSKQTSDSTLTIQFITCLLVVYTHVAMAFHHVSLAFPSSMVWSLLVAIPKYQSMPTWVLRLLFLVTCPGLILIPTVLTTYNSMYLRYIYLPLHFLLSTILLG